MKRRVVVTGIGMVTPLGNTSDVTWKAIKAGQSGVTEISHYDTQNNPTQISASVKDFHAADYIDGKDVKKLDPFIHFAVAAASEAVADSGIALSDEEKLRAGVAVGAGIGGLQFIADNHTKLNERGATRVSPFFIPGAIINMSSGYISIMHGFAGVNVSVVTACTTGTHNIALAARAIQYGDADYMLAGGSEMANNSLGLAGFSVVKALSTHNQSPEAASRPWDKDRDGFILGEGAGVVFLETYESAVKRGATIYGEILGIGMTGDAYHMVSPGGEGGYRAMEAALKDANLNTSAIDYINAHATSTKMGDAVEAKAIYSLFKRNMMVSSTKSMTGHLIGATGAVEAIFSLLAMRDSVIPPTINLDHPDPECDVGLDFVPHCARDANVKIALSNSFGFGGTNASIIMGKV